MKKETGRDNHYVLLVLQILAFGGFSILLIVNGIRKIFGKIK